MTAQDLRTLEGWVALPALPNGLRILDWRILAGDVIVISTEDGVTPFMPFVLTSGANEWQKLVVH